MGITAEKILPPIMAKHIHVVELFRIEAAKLYVNLFTAWSWTAFGVLMLGCSTRRVNGRSRIYGFGREEKNGIYGSGEWLVKTDVSTLVATSGNEFSVFQIFVSVWTRFWITNNHSNYLDQNGFGTYQLDEFSSMKAFYVQYWVNCWQ